jgi:hypothetical protein
LKVVCPNAVRGNQTSEPSTPPGNQVKTTTAHLEWSQTGGNRLAFVATKDASDKITITVTAYNLTILNKELSLAPTDPIHAKLKSIMDGTTPIVELSAGGVITASTWLDIKLTINDLTKDYPAVDPASPYRGEIEDWVVSNLGTSS